MTWNKIIISKNTFDKLKDSFNEVEIVKYNENNYYTNNGLEIIINNIPDNKFIVPKINNKNEI